MANASRLHAFAAALALMSLVGCQSVPNDPGPEATRATAISDAEAEAVLAAHNERVRRMERIWASCTIVAEGIDERGEPVTIQGEGYLQLERPDRVSLSFAKVGRTGFYLGSNADLYWWLDIVDRDNKSALVGRHDQLTPDKVRALGLPVRPKDLAWLLGVVPVDPERAEVLAIDDGFEISTRGDDGGAEITIRLRGPLLEPSDITVTRPGFGLARSGIDRYEPFDVLDDSTFRARVGTRFLITSPSFEGTLRLAIYDPQNRDIKPISFDLPGLLQRLRIERVLDLDASVPPQQPGTDAE